MYASCIWDLSTDLNDLDLRSVEPSLQLTEPASSGAVTGGGFAGGHARLTAQPTSLRKGAGQASPQQAAASACCAATRGPASRPALTRNSGGVTNGARGLALHGSSGVVGSAMSSSSDSGGDGVDPAVAALLSAAEESGYSAAEGDSDEEPTPRSVEGAMMGPEEPEPEPEPMAEQLVLEEGVPGDLPKSGRAPPKKRRSSEKRRRKPKNDLRAQRRGQVRETPINCAPAGPCPCGSCCGGALVNRVAVAPLWIGLCCGRPLCGAVQFAEIASMSREVCVLSSSWRSRTYSCSLPLSLTAPSRVPQVGEHLEKRSARIRADAAKHSPRTRKLADDELSAISGRLAQETSAAFDRMAEPPGKFSSDEDEEAAELERGRLILLDTKAVEEAEAREISKRRSASRRRAHAEERRRQERIQNAREQSRANMETQAQRRKHREKNPGSPMVPSPQQRSMGGSPDARRQRSPRWASSPRRQPSGKQQKEIDQKHSGAVLRMEGLEKQRLAKVAEKKRLQVRHFLIHQAPPCSTHPRTILPAVQVEEDAALLTSRVTKRSKADMSKTYSRLHSDHAAATKRREDKVAAQQVSRSIKRWHVLLIRSQSLLHSGFKMMIYNSGTNGPRPRPAWPAPRPAPSAEPHQTRHRSGIR